MNSNLIASSIYRALAADTNVEPSPNTERSFHWAIEKTSLKISNNLVTFDVKCIDVALLRASLNTFIRLAESSYKCVITYK